MGRQFVACLLIHLVCFTFIASDASPTVQEQLQELMDILSAQISRIETLETTNVEIKQVLAAKSVRLEALETEVERLKTILNASHNERSIILNADQQTKVTGKNAIFRTCRETHLADPSLASGLHWIDPDGQGVGDDPIQVYCNMTTGSTSVPHDSESPTDVGHCADSGCYSKPVMYSATMRQIIALADLSSECHQSIRYDCNYAPFEMNGVVYSWWNDRIGNPQYFWAGSNSSVHTCQCGIDHNCLETTTTCNCDSNIPVPEFDSGVITNKNLLPVTRLNFGRTVLETSSGVYTLGRFECSGQISVNGLPSSCTDLWQIGHTLSGLYNVMGPKFIETLYCDFAKLSSEQGYQTRIGFADVKSLPTYFSVQRNSHFSNIGTPITYDINRLNIGGAMSLASGIFTAPRKGKYFFSFSGVVARNGAASNIVRVWMKLNGNHIGETRSDGQDADWESISFQSALDLKTGDRVWFEIRDLVNGYLFSDAANIVFTGWLLEEDFS